MVNEEKNKKSDFFLSFDSEPVVKPKKKEENEK